MIALVDFDSIIYKSVYKCVSIKDMRAALEMMNKKEAKQWFLHEVVEQGINRCENILLNIIETLDEIKPVGYEITGYELYITTCSNSFRKKIDPNYKANRKRNKYVGYIRNHYMLNDNAYYSDTLEADDLISIRANKLGKDNCIVVSPDKDLKQIGGWYWSYYQQTVKNELGEVQRCDETGFILREYKQKEIEYISDDKANYLFWIQMLQGDASDNIKGVHRIGKVKANKYLEDKKVLWFAVARMYIEKGQKEDFKTNYQLLKLKTK